jgi:hypothetical protein
MRKECKTKIAKRTSEFSIEREERTGTTEKDREAGTGDSLIIDRRC